MNSRRRAPVRVALLLAGGLIVAGWYVATSAGAVGCDATWTGGGDATTWSDDANWSTGSAPQSGDVCVPTGTPGTAVVVNDGATRALTSLTAAKPLAVQNGELSLAQPSSVTGLALSGGSVGGAGTLTLTGASSWSGGQMRGPGTTVVATGSSLTLPDGAYDFLVLGRTLRVVGTMASGTGSLYGGNGAVLRVEGTWSSGATNVTGDYHYEAPDQTTPLTLATVPGATVAVDAGASQATWQGVRVDDDGTVTTSGGTLSVSAALADPPSSTGTFAATGTGSTLLSGGRVELGTGGRLDGVGVTGADVAVPTTASGKDVSLSGGSVSGAGTLSLTGASSWSGGQMRGPGTTVVATGASLALPDGAYDFLVLGRTLRVQGSMTSGAGSLYAGNGAVLRNEGTWAVGPTNVIGDYHYEAPDETTPLTVVNAAGAVVSADTGSATSAWQGVLVDNDGILTTTGGTLDVAAAQVPSPTSTGTFGASGGGVTSLSQGALVLGGQAAFAGATVSGAQVTLSSGADVRGPLRLTGGWVGGPGTLTLTGASTWSGGQMRGPGTTVVATGASLTMPDGAYDFLVLGRTLRNLGTVTSGAGSLYGGNGAVLRNEGTWSSGATNVVGDYQYEAPDETTPLSVVNAAGATVAVDAGSSSATWTNVLLDNDGTIATSAGSLGLAVSADSVATSAGTFAATGAGVTGLDAGPVTLGDGAALSGASLRGAVVTVPDGATVSVAGAHLLAGQLTGGGDLTVSGLTDWSGTELSGRGTATVVAGATLRLTDNGTLRGGRTLLNAGRFEVLGTLLAGESTVLRNTGTVDLTDGAYLAGRSYTTSLLPLPLQLDNAGVGTVTKTSGPGTAYVDVDLQSAGSVSSSSGVLDLAAGDGTSTGAFRATAAGALSITGALQLDTGAQLEDLTLTDGSVVARGTVTATRVVLDGGSVEGTGDVVVSGGMTLRDGSMSGRGATVVPVGETLTIAPVDFDQVRLLDSRLLSNAGTVLHQGGELVVGDGAFVDNAGTWTSSGTASVSGSYGDSPGLLYNAGVLRVTGGTTTVDGYLDNDGTVRVSGGSLLLEGALGNLGTNGTLSRGTFQADGGLLSLPGQVLTNAASLVLDGSGSALRVAGGQDLLADLVRNAPAGRVTVRGGASAAFAAENHGTVRVGAGSTLTASAGYVQRAGVTTVDAGGALTGGGAQGVQLLGGTLAGAGTVGPALQASGGAVAPGGNELGTLTVSGDYTAGSAHVLRAQVGAAGADRLVVSGTASLGGTLAASVKGTAPATGSPATVLSAGSVSGQHAAVSTSGLPAGQVFGVAYTATTVDVVATGAASGSSGAFLRRAPDKPVPSSSTSSLAGPVVGPVTVADPLATVHRPLDARATRAAATAGSAGARQAAGSRAVRGLVVQREATHRQEAARAAESRADASQTKAGPRPDQPTRPGELLLALGLVVALTGAGALALRRQVDRRCTTRTSGTGSG